MSILFSHLHEIIKELGLISFIINVYLALVAQMVKNLPAILETWVQSLGREDALEKSMATDSSILA